MKDALQSYMQVGIVHFMAYPECLKGEGPIYDTLTKIVEDEFFGAVEITWIKDPAERQRVKALLAASHMTVGYGAQPCLAQPEAEPEPLRPRRAQAGRGPSEGLHRRGGRGRGGGRGRAERPGPGRAPRRRRFKLLVDSVRRNSCSYAKSEDCGSSWRASTRSTTRSA